MTGTMLVERARSHHTWGGPERLPTSTSSSVTVTGRLTQRSYETKEGEKRTVFEVRVDQLAITLKGSQGSRSTPSKLDDDDPWANPAF